MLSSNGALRPLAALVLAAREELASKQAISAATTAAWALSNLIRGAGPEVQMGQWTSRECLLA